MHSDDSRRRDAASFFVLRNTAKARRRGWIVSASGGVDVTVNTSARGISFRWRTDDDDKRDAEAAEVERLQEEGKTVVSIGWDDSDKDKPEDGPLN